MILLDSGRKGFRARGLAPNIQTRQSFLFSCKAHRIQFKLSI